VGIATKARGLLESGDVVRSAIERAGEIENRVVAEPDGTAHIG